MVVKRAHQVAHVLFRKLPRNFSDTSGKESYMAVLSRFVENS
jgi:hypothetical protein